MFELQILLILMIIAAIVAVELKDLLGAIVAVGAVGLGLAIAFLFLQAPDLAIVQLVVEILSIIILIRAVSIAKETTVIAKERRFVSILPVVVLIALFIYFSLKALFEIPPFGSPILKVAEKYISNGLKETGAANIVAAVILDYRALDTLGEATVLFTAVIGVLAVIRKVGRKK